jgi:hypothetical protein
MVFKFTAGIVASHFEWRELRLDSPINLKASTPKWQIVDSLPYRNRAPLLDGDAPNDCVSAFPSQYNTHVMPPFRVTDA